MADIDTSISAPSTSNDSFGIEQDSVQEDGSSNDSVEFNIVTKAMVEEERLIAEEAEQEEAEFKKEYEERMKREEKEERYDRLMHLLSKSQFYSLYLRNKLDANAQQLKEQVVAKKKKLNVDNTRTLAEKNLNVADTKLSQSDENGNKKEVSPDGSSARTSPNRSSSRKRKANTTYTKDFVSPEEMKSPKRLNLNVHDVENESPLTSQDKTIVTDSDSKENKPPLTKVTGLGLEVPVEQPDLLEGGILRDYQLEGLQWLKLLYEYGMNGILADEMGLGKTIQVIAYICHLISKGVKGPFLIVAPLSTLSNWILEFERFAPQIPVVLFHGSVNERQALYRLISKCHKVSDFMTKPVVVTSYEVPLKECYRMSRIEWKYLIVDEGHRLKNSSSLLFRVLRTMNVKNQLLLTGTPLQNNLTELWSLLNFLLPEIFDDLSTFEAWFDVQEMENAEGAEKIIEQEREQQVISILHQILQPFLLRRMKIDIVLNFPPKKEVMVYCPMTDIQMEMYKCIVDKTIKSLLSTDVDLPSPRRRSTSKYSSDKSKPMPVKINEYFPLETMPACRTLTKRLGEQDEKGRSCFVNRIPLQNTTMVLKHIVNHPYLVRMPVEYNDKGKPDLRITKDLLTVSGKLLVLDAMLSKLKEKGHKVLLFCTSTMMLDLLEEYVIMANYSYLRLDGSTKILTRKNDIYAFNTDPNIFIFLLSSRAGGLGINLVGADTVILYNSDWNPQVDLQAQDRAHRIGQTRPVVVYRFNVAGTVDEKIISRAFSKRKLEKIVMKYGAFTPGKRNSYIDLQELRELLKETNTHKQIHSNGFIFTDKELEELLDRSDLIENKSKDENCTADLPKESAASTKKTKSAAPQRKLYEILNGTK